MLACTLLMTACSQAQSNDIVAEGETPVRVADSYSFTEGLEKTQIHLAFCSLIRIFASEKEKDDGNTRCKIQTLRVAAG